MAFKYFGIFHIPRYENTRADILSQQATSTDDTLGQTYIEHLETLSIKEVKMVQQVDHEPS